MKYVNIVARSIVAEDYVKKWMNILLRRRGANGNNMTDEQKDFYEDLLMEQQEQM